MPSRRRPGPAAPVRVRRAAAFAAASAALSVTAHAVGGGMLPNLWLVLLGTAPVAGAGVLLAGREATLLRLAVGLAAAQAAMHGWLAAMGPHHAHAGAAEGSATGRMLAAHVVAGLAALVWLRLAEDRVWRAARRAWVGLIVQRRRWINVPPVPYVAELAPAGTGHQPTASGHLTSAMGLRGPPAPARATSARPNRRRPCRLAPGQVLVAH